MMNWQTDKESNQWYAHSDMFGGRTYWIIEMAWTYLEIVDKDPVVQPMPFLTVDDAKEYAEKQECNAKTSIATK